MTMAGPPAGILNSVLELIIYVSLIVWRFREVPKKVLAVPVISLTVSAMLQLFGRAWFSRLSLP